MAPLQVQDLAIRCIQKNIKKNRGVKGWPWWKLFTNVRPLVEVQLTEEQIRGRDVSVDLHGETDRHPKPRAAALLCVCVCSKEEIQQLKMKLEKAEKERNELRLNSERLESRVSFPLGPRRTTNNPQVKPSRGCTDSGHEAQGITPTVSLRCS